MTKARKPIIGEAFDSHFMNDSGRIACYMRELRYYRPRGFAALVKEGETILADLERIEAGKHSRHFTAGVDVYQAASEWESDVESMLTEWARRTMRNEYVCFGPMSESWGGIGFWYAVDSAIEDCDIRLDAGDSVPTGFSGMAAFVTDHGNVTIQTYSRGRMTRELLSVV